MTENFPSAQEMCDLLVKYRFIDSIMDSGEHLTLNKSKYFLESMDLIFGNIHFEIEWKRKIVSIEEIVTRTPGSGIPDHILTTVVSLIEFHLDRQGIVLSEMTGHDLSSLAMGVLKVIGEFTENGYKLHKV